VLVIGFRADTPAAIKKLAAKKGIATARALNRSADSMNTALGRVVAADLGVGVSLVRARLSVRRATEQRQAATIYANAKRIPLIDLKARGNEPSRGKGRGVTAMSRGVRVRYPEAFIATMKSGHRGVFARAGASRSGRGLRSPSPGLPIRELFGPSVAQSFSNQINGAASRQYWRARMEELLTTNLRREFRFVLAVEATAA
jgi:hypothetical protein